MTTRLAGRRILREKKYSEYNRISDKKTTTNQSRNINRKTHKLNITDGEEKKCSERTGHVFSTIQKRIIRVFYFFNKRVPPATALPSIVFVRMPFSFRGKRDRPSQPSVRRDFRGGPFALDKSRARVRRRFRRECFIAFKHITTRRTRCDIIVYRCREYR